MAKYTIDPATGGFGIYLVYRFGEANTKRSPDGVRLESTSQLKKLLEASLTEPEQRRIFVSVVDLSTPQERR